MRRPLLVLALALCLVPCLAPAAAQEEAELPAAAPATAQAPSLPAAPPPAASSEVELLAVPFPDLATLEEPVARQLGELQGVLAREFERRPPDRAQLAEAFGELGRHYQAYDLAEAAAVCFENARRLAPGAFRWPYHLGVLLQGQGRHAEAVAAYVNALTVGAGSVNSLYHLAEIFIQENRLHEAKVLLGRVLELDPDSPAALAALGQVALAEERWGDAVAYLEGALGAVPQADRLHHPLGLAYRGLGDAERAREHLERAGAIGVRPPDPLIDDLAALKTGERAHLLRGQQAFRAGDYPAAVDAFRRAVATAPESAAAQVNLGSALAQLGDRGGAVERYREALRLDPESAAAHFNLGLLLLAEKATAGEALEHLTAAADLDPDDGEARLQLAAALRQAGRIEESLTHWAAAARLLPGDDRPWLGGADALLALGRAAEARQRLEQGQERMPQQGRLAHALARLLAAGPDPELRDGARALELAAAVYEASTSVEHAETVALALAELGRCAEAADWQRQAVEAVEAAGAKAPASYLEALRARLAGYQAGEPCRPPTARAGTSG